jgi:hypothetical protein
MTSHIKQTIFILCFLPIFCKASAQANIVKVSVAKYGAKGDGKTDDSNAIINAIKAGDEIVFPKGKYLITKTLRFTNLSNKHIFAYDATIINSDNTVPSIVFDTGNDITIEGGTWARLTLPTAIGAKNNENTFTFITIKNLVVKKIHIIGSPEMGICMMNVVHGIITNNTIEKCFRDGIYSHYSAKLTYAYNHLEDIKDDAMSIHDYGLTEQKAVIIAAGYSQAGHAVVINNVVKNAYEGFSSIGCDSLYIAGNNISNTVNAGIAVFNSETLFKGSTARVKNVFITNNKLSYTGGAQKIMGGTYSNNGQLSTGRCALYVAVNDASNLINNPTTRLSNIKITKNVITNSYVNGAYIAQIDGLIFENNSFTDCDIDRSHYSGRIVEIRNCTNASIFNNSVIDDREKILHDAGYETTNISGKMGNWIVKGHLDPVAGYTLGVHP